MLDHVCIAPGFWGEGMFLIIDLTRGTFRWSMTQLPDAWTLGAPDAGLDLSILARLSGMPLRMTPGPEFASAFAQLGATGIRWRHAVPKLRFDAFVAGLLDDIRGLLGTGCVAYHTQVFRRTQECLRALETCRVDGARLDGCIRHEPNESVRSTLWSFGSVADGYAGRVVYDQLSTVTGRLVVTRGPRVTTLPKRYRDIVVSRFPGGSIGTMDFRSLEPRVILASEGRSAGIDIYDDVCRSIPTLNREQAKVLTISLLYGAGEETLERVSGLSGPDLFGATQALTAYFGLDGLHRRLNDELGASGRIRNRYGRPIFIDAAAQRKLVNYWAQSTAVDCALLGFGQGIDLVRRMGWRIVPLYVVHDALVVDVHPDDKVHIDGMMDECSRMVGFSQPFPLRYEELNVG